MTRVSVYIKHLTVSGMLRKIDIQGNDKTLIPNKFSGTHSVPSAPMSPGEEYDVIASELVELNMFTKDVETNSFVYIDSKITTDKLKRIEVRGFELRNVFYPTLKQTRKEAVVLVDLVY